MSFNIKLPFYNGFHNRSGLLRVKKDGVSGYEEILNKHIEFHMVENGKWIDVGDSSLGKKTVYRKGIVRSKGDIFIDNIDIKNIPLEELKMDLIVDGVVYNVVSYSQPRNPDGTINHTKMELI